MHYIQMSHTDTVTGFTGDCWVITRLAHGPLTQKCSVTLGLFKDVAAVGAGKKPITEKTFVYSFDPDGTFTGDQYYTDVKAESFFSAGTIVEV